MVTEQIKSQLKNHFSNLKQLVTLEVFQSSHPKASELQQMVSDVASCGEKVDWLLTETLSEVPRVDIKVGGEPVGISFVGVPGGHEFSSFILGILNAGGLGKLPDDGLQRRIARLKTRFDIKTVVSLSCENCPDVVQSLNLVSLFNDQISHQMIDGGVATAEAERLGVASVPAVFVDDKLIHSGRGTLVDLIEKLEALAPDSSQSESDEPVKHYDVAVIGAGPAGASAAIYTARKGLKTVIITDKVGGQVQETKGIENMISVVYTEGPQLAASLLEHIRAYDIDLLEHRRVSRIHSQDEHLIEMAGGERIQAKSIIVATGAKWRQLGVPGEADYLGRGVAYCPHCDGPFYKDKSVAVIGGGNSGVEAAIDLAATSSDVTLIEFLPELKADQVLLDQLATKDNNKVITNAATQEILGNGEKVIGLNLKRREEDQNETITLDGVFVQIGLVPNSQVVKNLVETNQFGEILIDEKCRTNVPGIYAAGDVTTTPYKQIVVSLGEGAKAGLAVFEDRMHSSVI